MFSFFIDLIKAYILIAYIQLNSTYVYIYINYVSYRAMYNKYKT